MATSAGAVYVDVKANTGQFEQQMDGLGDLASKLSKTVKFAAVARFAKECTDLASELTELQNVVDQVFPTMNARLDEWSQNLISTFGLSEAKAKHYAGTMASMARSMGFTEEQAYAMSTRLAELSGDIASFYDMSSDEAFTKLESVFTGMVQPLRSLGINMTQASLDAYALANGWGRTCDEMSEAELTLLRYQYVLDRTQFAQGDAARTSGTWANQLRQLQMNFESLEATLGAQFVDALLPALTTLNSMIVALDDLAQRINLVQIALGALGALFPGINTLGYALGLNSGKAGGLNKTLSKTNKLSEATAESTLGLASAQGGAAGSAGSQGRATEKLNRILAGFDRINKLSSSHASAGGGGGGGGGSVGGIGADLLDQLLGGDIAKIAGYDKDYFKRAARLDYSDRFQSSYGKRYGTTKVASELRDIWSDDDSDIISKLEKSAKSISKMLQERIKSGDVQRQLNRAGGSTLGRGIAGNVLGKSIGIDAEGIGGLAEAWNSINSKTAKLTAVTSGKDKVDALKTPYDSIKSKVAKLSAQVTANGTDIAKSWTAAVGSKWKDKKAILGRTFAKNLGDGSVARNWTAAIAGKWKDKDAALGRKFTSGVSVEAMKSSWTARIGNQWKAKNATLGRKFNDNTAKSAIQEQWTSRVDKTWKAKSVYLTANQGTSSSAVSSWWNNATSSWQDKWATLYLETKLKGVSKASIKNSWTGETLAGLEVVPTSWMAQGGYIGRNTPRLAVIGDNTREGEIVSPESKFQTMLDQAVQQGGGNAETVRMLGLILQAVQSIDPNVYIDSRDVTRAVVGNINRQVQSTGRSPLYV